MISKTDTTGSTLGGENAYQLLEGSVELSHRVFKDNTNRLVKFVLGLDCLEQPLCILLIVLLARADGAFDHSDADDFITIVNHVVQQPNQRVIGIGMFVDANHKGAGSPRRLVALVSDMKGK